MNNARRLHMPDGRLHIQRLQQQKKKEWDEI